MDNKPRFAVPGVPQHVVQRGRDCAPCFSHESDYSFFLDCARDAAVQHLCAVHAYVLMRDHVHFLVTPASAEGITHFMRQLRRRYAVYYDGVRGNAGVPWEGRFRASLVEARAFLLTCYRYVELNPVRVGLVDHPGSYRWSSYMGNAFGRPDPVITPHSLYLELGSSEYRRQCAYRSLFQAPFDDGELRRIRAALNREGILGDDAFWRDRLPAPGSVAPPVRGRRRKRDVAAELAALESLLAQEPWY